MRSMGKFSVGALILACTSVAVVLAEEPTTKPAREVHGPRLIKPYSDMKTLTPDEKEKIAEIHKKVREEETAIEDKEEEDIEDIDA